jgi:ubiquinone/menaquinone biosynthesis C-methylase UbiE
VLDVQQYLDSFFITSSSSPKLLEILIGFSYNPNLKQRFICVTHYRLMVKLLPGRSIDYDTVSSIYDKVRAGEPEMIFHILEEFVPDPDSRVLDIGCGTGNNTLLFKKAVEAQVFGLDSSFGMLLEARSKAPQVFFIHASADYIPLKSESFDMLFMTEVVHHLPDVNSAMKEMSRILKPAGRLCIVTQSHRQIEDRMTSRFFPATVPIDKQRYPTIPSIEDSMIRHSLAETWSKSFRFVPIILGEEYMNTVSRKGYSMLHKISANDYESGLLELRRVFERGEQLDYAAGYTFVWGQKSD